MNIWIKIFAISSASLLGLWLAISQPSFLPPKSCHAAGLTVITLALWATGFIAEYLTALFFFTGTMLFAIAPPEVVFSGFSSGAFWLIFGGLVLGVAINVTGLGKRIAGRVASRLDRHYTWLIGGLVLSGLVSGLLMPSALGRVVLLVPIAINIAGSLGFARGRKGYTGVTLAATLGCFLPGFTVLPANVPNMVLSGLSEKLYTYSPLYGEYLSLHFPVLGVVKGLLLWLLVLLLYPDAIDRRLQVRQQCKEPMSTKEKALSIILLVMLGLWITDFLHHISPAWIAMLGACIVMLPFTDIVRSKLFGQNINFASLFYIAGILGLGQMINHSGIGQALAR